MSTRICRSFRRVLRMIESRPISVSRVGRVGRSAVAGANLLEHATQGWLLTIISSTCAQFLEAAVNVSVFQLGQTGLETPTRRGVGSEKIGRAHV